MATLRFCRISHGVLPLLAACSAGGSGADSAASYAESSSAASCAYLVRCGFMPDVSGCQKLPKSETFNTTIDAIKLGRVKYDAAKAGACFSATSSGACTHSDQDEAALESLCRPVLQGTVAAGAPCYVDAECTSGECDVPSCVNTCCEGSCAPIRAPAGSPCLYDNGYCDSRSFCDTTLSQPVCKPLLAAGAGCSGNSQCRTGLGCSLTAPVPTCVARSYPADGQACTDGDTCDNVNSYCSSTSKLCTPRVPAGGACTLDLPVTNCAVYAECVDGVCVRGTMPGEMCNIPMGIPCLGGTCIDGVCTASPPAPSCYEDDPTTS